MFSVLFLRFLLNTCSIFLFLMFVLFYSYVSCHFTLPSVHAPFHHLNLLPN